MDISNRYKGLIDFIAERYNKAVEIGIGRFPYMAHSLIDRGIILFATDIYPHKLKGLKVIKDDVLKPNISLYRGVQMIYSIRPPSELVPYMVELANKVSADLIIKPLSSDYLNGRFRCYKNTTFFVWEHL